MNNKRSLQWRITLMTAVLIAFTCVTMMLLLGRSGLRHMDEIGENFSAYENESETNNNAHISFDPQKSGREEQLTIVIGEAQERFTLANLFLTAGVTILSAVIAYFVSGRALRPLQTFSKQLEKVQLTNLSDMHIDTDTPKEFRAIACSFNDMIERLSLAFDAQRKFTGNAAHELRTPLSLLQMQLDLYEEEHPNSDEATLELIKFLKEQSWRLSDMVKTLLEMSSLESIPRTDSISLLPMLEEIITDLSPLAEKKHIRLSLEGEDINLTGSDALLSRLFFNLTENAIKYNVQGGKVKITAKKNKAKALIGIEDSGHGIPESFRNSIFQPFFRIDSSRSRSEGGVGLGLALVWEICRLHGGNVRVERSSEKGTLMLVSLPISKTD